MSSGLPFATAGYIGPPCPPTTIVIEVVGELQGTIVEEEALSGVLVEEEALSGVIRESCDAIGLQFVGWTLASPPFTEADIFGLTELDLGTGFIFDVTLSPTNGGAGARLVHAYVDAHGPAAPTDYIIGDLGPGDVTEVQTGLSISMPGGAQSCRVAVSDFLIEAPGGVRFRRTS